MRTIGRLTPLVRPHLPALALSVTLLAVVGVAEAGIMMLIKPVIDDVLTDTPGGGDGKYAFLYRLFGLEGPDLYIRVAWALLWLTLIKCVCLYVSNYQTIRVGQRVVQRLRDNLFRHLLNQSAAFFTRHPTGPLMSRVINDVDRVQDAVSKNLADLVRQSLTLVAIVAVLFYIDPWLSGASFAALPLIAWLTGQLGRKVRRYGWLGQEHLGQLNGALQETLTGVRVVQAFGQEHRETERFQRINAALVSFNLKLGRIVSFNPPLMELMGVLVFIPLIIYAHFRIQDGLMTTGSFGVFLASMIRLYDPIRRISRMHLTFQQTFASVDRIFELLDHREEVPQLPGAPPLAPLRAEVRFAGVSFQYTGEGGVTIPTLVDVDLRVKRGQVLAIVGASGAGKTTLVSLIPRFFDPVAGAVRIDGVDIRHVDLASLRRQVAIVSQETVLFNDTVGNNIRYGTPDAPAERVEAAARAALAHDFIQAMPAGYETIVGERGVRLSGGERQRLSIARALLRDAPLLILDEATSALDSESEALVQQALSNLMANRTTLVIAHRLSTIRRADRIAVLDRGRVVETGTHDQLLAAGGLYRRLHDLQFQTG